MTQQIKSTRLGILLGAALVTSGYTATAGAKGTTFKKGDTVLGDLDNGWTKRPGTEGDFTSHTQMTKDLGNGSLAIADDDTADTVAIMTKSSYYVGAAQELRAAGFTVQAPTSRRTA